MNQSSSNMTPKIFVLAPREDWIVDRFVEEWNCFSNLPRCDSPRDADIIWILADWAWRNILSQIRIEDLARKKVVTTVHHIVPEKFGNSELQDFMIRDSITTHYHVYNERTRDFISRLTKKPITLIRYWANDKFWIPNFSKNQARENAGISQDLFLIGSFQRDTEGHDLKSPKLEKGPDIFCDFVESFSLSNKNTHVVLGGWRRQYVMNRLSTSGIPFTFFERPALEFVKTLYSCLDVYAVSSRCEGGPQALIECGLMRVPCISRPVGIAEQVLSNQAIKENLLDAIPEVPNIENMRIERVMPEYVDFFRDLLLES